METMWISCIFVLDFLVQREQCQQDIPQNRIWVQQKGFFLHCALTDWSDWGKGIIAAILHTDMVKHNEMIKVEGISGMDGIEDFQQQQQRQQQQQQQQQQLQQQLQLQLQQQQQQGIVYQVATLVWWHEGNIFQGPFWPVGDDQSTYLTSNRNRWNPAHIHPENNGFLRGVDWLDWTQCFKLISWRSGRGDHVVLGHFSSGILGLALLFMDLKLTCFNHPQMNGIWGPKKLIEKTDEEVKLGDSLCVWRWFLCIDNGGTSSVLFSIIPNIPRPYFDLKQSYKIWNLYSFHSWLEHGPWMSRCISYTQEWWYFSGGQWMLFSAANTQ